MRNVGYERGRQQRDSAVLPASARVCRVVDAGQMLEIKVRVDLRGRNVSVPEQFLYAAQIAAGFQKMGGKRVPEEVWMDALRQASPTGPVSDALLYGTRT